MIRQESAESLEILVPALSIGRAGVQVGAVVVALPDLNQCIADRLSRRVKYATGEVSDLPNAGRDAVVDDDQVVVSIKRQTLGIERPFGLSGGSNQLLCKSARHSEKRGTE